MAESKRQNLFTNFKAFLIFTVVFGHFVQCMPDSTVRSFLMLYIYSFHMPAFVFVSGYFSKNVTKGADTAFERYFIPFLYMTVIYVVINLLISGTIYIRFVVPVFAAWYVLVIFYYKIMLKYISKFRMQIVLPVSIVLSVLVGVVPFIGSKLCLERTVAFLPFFLAGYYLTKERLDAIRTKIPKWAAGAVLVLIGAGCAVYVAKFEFNYQVTLCNTSYALVGFSNGLGMLHRLYFTGMALVMTMLLLIVMPEKQLKFSYIGDNTMSVYALHCIFFLIVRKTNVWASMSTVAALICSLLLAAAVVLLLSIPKINQIYMAGIEWLCRMEKKHILGIVEKKAVQG